MNLKIKISKAKVSGRNAKIVQFFGHADGSNVDEVNTTILKFLENGDIDFDLILDGSSLNFVNSTFIGFLNDWSARTEKRNRKLVLANFQPNTIDTIKTVGILDLIPHFESVTDAEQFLVKV